MSVAQFLSGDLFLLIIVFNLLSARYGYQTFSDLDPVKQLESIVDSPRKFRLHFVLIIIEHLMLIAVVTTLFIAFNEFNLMLAIAWVVLRSAESILQIYFKKDYRRLLPIAEHFASAGEADKTPLIEQTLSVLVTKNTVFTIAQMLFSAGTLCYSILFFAYNISPVYLSLFGIAAASIYGLGSFLKLVIDYKMVWNIGGLLILVYEAWLGVWLIIDSFSGS